VKKVVSGFEQTEYIKERIMKYIEERK